ncbi:MULTISPECIES: VRR-NUC domain-containing protein [Burkholderia]|uniref:VRR-NUC domain-containing protein n=1 Tax=Burkholderia TaxID=32008 RepID=UPI0019698E79|nr:MULTISPECIES: VRR-NUC domain-containing protein [Burkholderia]
MLEKTVETYLVDRVRVAGGDAYKFSSPARVSVPDRIVVFPPARIYFVELKRPGGVVTKGQLREHERLRALGCDVRVIDSREAVDAFVREASAHRADVMVEQIIAAAMDCIRHDVSPDWQRAALRNKLSAILAATPASQPAAAPIEYRYEGGTHWCDLGPAERMRPVFKGVYRLKAGTFPVWAGEPAPSPADERAAFERELVKRVPNAQLQLRDADDEVRPGEYEHPTHEFAWRMWQARAASANEMGDAA